MSRLLLLAALLVLMTLPAGCSDDDPAAPEPFAVTLRVVDNDGDPVPGLVVSVTSNNDYLQESFAKAAVAIPFTVVTELHGRVTVEDIEGDAIRVLVDEHLDAGQHRVVWDGRDNHGIHMPSGYYVARLVAYVPETDTVLWDGTAPMLLCTFDTSQAPVGATDDDGRIVLDDKRLFPHLYGVPPFPATDETGQIVGQITLDEEMIFTVADTAGQTTMFVVTEVSGPGKLEFLWSPRPQPAPGRPDRPRAAPVGELPEPVFAIGPVYPNPFN